MNSRLPVYEDTRQTARRRAREISEARRHGNDENGSLISQCSESRLSDSDTAQRRISSGTVALRIISVVVLPTSS